MSTYKFPTIRLVFDRRRQATKDRPGAVTIQINHMGVRRWIETGVAVPVCNWDASAGVYGRPDAPELNLRIEARVKPMRDRINQALVNGEQISIDDVVETIEVKKSTTDFIGYVEARIRSRKDIRESTRKQHAKVPGILRRFGQIRYFDDLQRVKIVAFDRWLHEQTHKVRSTGETVLLYQQATIQTIHKIVKVYINMAIADEIIRDNPYATIKIDRGRKAERRYLTDDELAKIETAELPTDSLRRVRDLFVLQCYTGLAYADMCLFDRANVVERDGRRVLVSRRQKTDTDYYIVLMPQVIEILDRYGWRLPLMTAQQYNIRLNVLADAVGLDRHITSHMGRHTFAVRCLNHGVSIETLARMMGHSDIKTTQIYARILDETVESAFDGLRAELDRSAQKTSQPRQDAWGWDCGQNISYM